MNIRKSRRQMLGLFPASAALALMGRPVREPDREELHKEAVAKSLIPIRPGIPGKRPFWNEYSRRFIYAPAFSFRAVPGAASYRFTAVAGDGPHVFEAEVPWAALNPIWTELPVGKVT